MLFLERSLRSAIVCFLILLNLVSPLPVCAQDTGSQATSNQAKAREIEVDGRKRHYYWYSPEHAKAKNLPVILAFHGGGRASVPGGETLDRYIDLTKKATKAGFVVVYPDGYKHSWNAGPGPDNKSPNWGPAYAENVDDVKFVKALLDDLDKNIPIDRQRIYATGMSNGSAMAFRLAVDLADQIAAVAGVVSEISLYGPISMKRAVPMMYFWGTVDPIERPGAPSPAERARRNTETWKGLNSCAGKPEILVKGAAERQTFHGKAPVVIWTVKGMGHCWPGVTNGPLEARILGPQNLDVSASTEIINFFDEHPLR